MITGHKRIRGQLLYIVACASVALACSAAGGGEVATAAADSGAPAAGTAQNGSVPRASGTLRATIDGTARTWHVVSGTSQGRRYASGVWIDVTPDRKVVAIGGFDTATPPLDSFTWGPNNMPTSYGDYAGSTLLINLNIQGAPAPFRLLFPPEPTPAVMYSTKATLNSLDTTFAIEKGTVDVTAISVAGGLVSATGTFSGTLARMTGEGTVEVTDGSFNVSGIPDAKTMQR